MAFSSNTAAPISTRSFSAENYNATVSYNAMALPWFADYMHLVFWFFFLTTFIISLWLVQTFALLVRSGEARSPVRETRGFSRAQTGDSLTAVIPMCWSITMLMHASTHSSNFDENTDSTSMAFTVIAYQWGWNYFFPSDTISRLRPGSAQPQPASQVAELGLSPQRLTTRRAPIHTTATWAPNRRSADEGSILVSAPAMPLRFWPQAPKSPAQPYLASELSATKSAESATAALAPRLHRTSAVSGAASSGQLNAAELLRKLTPARTDATAAVVPGSELIRKDGASLDQELSSSQRAPSLLSQPNRSVLPQMRSATTLTLGEVSAGQSRLFCVPSAWEDLDADFFESRVDAELTMTRQPTQTRLSTVGGLVSRLRVTSGVTLPSDTPIHLICGSKDVIHSWAVPGLSIKIDCIPGYNCHRRLLIRWRGLFWGQCMEVCGRYHHWMPLLLRVSHVDVFILWLSSIS